MISYFLSPRKKKRIAIKDMAATSSSTKTVKLPPPPNGGQGAVPSSTKKYTLNKDHLKQMTDFILGMENQPHNRESSRYLIDSVLNHLRFTTGISKTDIQTYFREKAGLTAYTQGLMVSQSRQPSSPSRTRSRGGGTRAKASRSVSPEELSIRQKYGPNYLQDPKYIEEIRVLRQRRRQARRSAKA